MAPHRGVHVVLFGMELGCLTGLAQGSLATGADVQANAYTVDDDALLVHVGAKIPARAALGEAHIISKSLGLATDITFPGHKLAPFNILFLSQRLGIQKQARPETRGNHIIRCAQGHQRIAELAAIQRRMLPQYAPVRQRWIPNATEPFRL